MHLNDSKRRWTTIVHALSHPDAAAFASIGFQRMELSTRAENPILDCSEPIPSHPIVCVVGQNFQSHPCHLDGAEDSIAVAVADFVVALSFD